MQRVLLIDDNHFYLKAMQTKLQSVFPQTHFDTADSAQTALTAVDENSYDLVICDLILPDNNDGSIIKMLADKGHRVVVITDFTDEILRKDLNSFDIVDYVIKSDSDNFSYLITLLKQLESNKHRYVMIVDDSNLARIKLKDILTRHNLNIIEASSGEEAVEMIPALSRLDLLITDHEMKKIDGLELTKVFRKHFAAQELPIIALTGSNNQALVARYLKTGANDYIQKPFSPEELLCRVSTLISIKDMFDELKTIAITDKLTTLHNRFYLHETGALVVDMAQRSQKPLSLAIFDIDFFKKINDTYGHLAGDATIARFATILKKAFRKTDILVRFGGEEFVVIMPDTPLESAVNVCEMVRATVGKIPMSYDNQTFSLTVSVGVDAIKPEDNLQTLMQRVDTLLYEAKSQGRNRTVSSEGRES